MGHMDWKYENYKKVFKKLSDSDFEGEISTEDYEYSRIIKLKITPADKNES